VERPEASPTLRDYLAVVWRRKWYVLLVTIVVLAVAFLYTTRQTPLYKSSAEVLVLPVNFSPTEPSTQEAPANMVNEVRVATSSEVTQLAADELEKRGLSMAGVSVDTPTGSGLLVIEAVSPNPASAQATADAFANAYLKFRLNVILDDLRAISAPLQRRLGIINNELIQTQQSLLEGGSESAQAGLQIRLGSLFSQRSLLEQKLNELVLPENLRVGEVLQPAVLPAEPFSPDRTKIGSFALFVGLSLGVGIAFLRDRLDPRLRGREELEIEAEAPVLGTIPSDRARIRRRAPRLASLQQADSPTAEAYRVLRAKLSASVGPREVASLVITSPHSREGTTTVTANLAVAFARSGRRTIVISDDLSGPALQLCFPSPNGIGLPDVLKERALVQAALMPASIPYLWGLHGGYATSDFEALISTDALKRMRSELGNIADVVLIDAPPVLEDADTLTLASLVGGVLLVADVSRTTATSVREAKLQLEHLAVRVVGAVLMNANKARSQTTPRRGYRRVAGPSDDGSGVAAEDQENIEPEREEDQSADRAAYLRRILPHG
jgi:capsular exopolysaccharide synthesis family protein